MCLFWIYRILFHVYRSPIIFLLSKALLIKETFVSLSGYTSIYKYILKKIMLSKEYKIRHT